MFADMLRDELFYKINNAEKMYVYNLCKKFLTKLVYNL